MTKNNSLTRIRIKTGGEGVIIAPLIASGLHLARVGGRDMLLRDYEFQILS